MQIRVSYEKAIKKLMDNKLSDGKFFVMAQKNYVIWAKNWIFTTNGDKLAITPFTTKNNPKVEKAMQIVKSDIANFATSNWKRAFIINLKNGTAMKYTTTDVDIRQRVEILNKWLSM